MENKKLMNWILLGMMILLLIIAVIILIVFLKEIKWVKLIVDPCRICMNKTGCTCFCLEHY